jgi:hypothetical protein
LTLAARISTLRGPTPTPHGAASPDPVKHPCSSTATSRGPSSTRS